jgi:UDPglucose--hexose-1-phosphate uridylyltransferase
MIDISINLSKPEKDPKEIAKLKELKNNTKYPKCQLCYENVGYQGRANHPARNNLRVIPVKLNNEDFYLQYSPYGYFNEHAIILKREHENMKISEITFIRLLDFLDMFPHYFIGSNADLPIVGGSILDHEHYQGGRATFAMDNAKVLYQKNIGHVQVNYLDWPLDTIELETGKEHRDELLKLANQILYKWRRYSKPSINIFNSLEDLHNTITPIARMRNNNYVLKLVLRNNYTTSEKPYGLYHPDVDLHHIKKENIGLIEVLGLAILPARLKKELTILDEIVQGKRNESDIELIANHKEWYEEIKNMENLNINNEVGKIFVKVLESCKVFKYGSIDDVIEFIDSFVI